MQIDTKKRSQSWAATVCSKTCQTSRIADCTIGEPIVEPEVDLSSFLERQRISDPAKTERLSAQQESDEDDVDQSLAHLTHGKSSRTNNMKGKAVTVEWTEGLAAMEKQKNEADANRGIITAFWLYNQHTDPYSSDLRERFRAKSDRLRKPVTGGHRPKGAGSETLEDAPALPGAPVKAPKEEMEDFLDELLG
jgi:hypothetical protein